MYFSYTKFLGYKNNLNLLNIKYIQTANFGQQTANFGQIVTYFRHHGVGYDLATELCLYLAFYCLSSPTLLQQKSPTII